MKKFFTILTLIFYLSLQTAYGINIIRDSEIEETISLVIEPLKRVSGLKNLKIYLLDDQTSNAFTVGGEIIFVHSGLIIKFPDPDVLRGVIAHEIGHILGHHVVRRQKIVDDYMLLALSSAAVGLAASIGNQSQGLAVMLAGRHIADRSVMAYSRGFESSADQTALRLLEKSHNSSIGMIKFFEQTKINAKYDLINPYDQTHPLGHERLRILKNYNQKSKYNKSQNSAKLIYKFHRIAVKLAAYTLEINQIPDSDKAGLEFTNYLQAIKSFRQGSFDQALAYTNKLLQQHPDDPYYHELKGQILFEAGRAEDLEEYNIAWQLKRNDPLIVLGRAVIGITKYKDQPEKLDEFYKNLQFVLAKEPDNMLALYYGAIYYEKKGMKSKGYLNSAIIADKYGNSREAVLLATEAIKGFNPNTPDWYKAHDIIEANK